METGIEDIIKSVIHIDKGAVHMKQDVDSQIAERRKAVAGQVARLKQTIVEERKAQAIRKKDTVLEAAQKEAQAIIDQSRLKAERMQEDYEQKKQAIVKDVFQAIFMTK